MSIDIAKWYEQNLDLIIFAAEGLWLKGLFMFQLLWMHHLKISNGNIDLSLGNINLSVSDIWTVDNNRYQDISLFITDVTHSN